ncbi:hypothetical protein CFP56_035085 [Quercus suber]|uniref:Uncharacterized protein n=1 Tax=Quercus suber TaxID=58331 RepID=A0AAW0JB13_QUESU
MAITRRINIGRTVGNDSNSEKSTALIARDLLGGGSNSFSSSTSKLVVDSQELDLDSQVPNGWEKHLDLKEYVMLMVNLCAFAMVAVRESLPTKM